MDAKVFHHGDPVIKAGGGRATVIAEFRDRSSGEWRYVVVDDLAFNRHSHRHNCCDRAGSQPGWRRPGSSISGMTTDGAAAPGHPTATAGPAQGRQQGLTHRQELFYGTR